MKKMEKGEGREERGEGREDMGERRGERGEGGRWAKKQKLCNI
jgi:hypothetical protein